MKLKTIILRNFRGYRQETHIAFDNRTVFIAYNDSGQSIIPEALGTLFEGDLVKRGASDASVSVDSSDVHIGCAFTELPTVLTNCKSVIPSWSY